MEACAPANSEGACSSWENVWARPGVQRINEFRKGTLGAMRSHSAFLAKVAAGRRPAQLRTWRHLQMVVLVGLVLAPVGCDGATRNSPSGSVEIDLPLVVATVDAIVAVEVVASDPDDRTTTIRIDQVEWRAPGADLLPASRFQMWWFWQDRQSVEAGEHLVVLLTHIPEVKDEMGSPWRASYVLRGETLEPLPPVTDDPGLVSANQELQGLYGSEQLSREEKLRRLVSYVEART